MALTQASLDTLNSSIDTVKSELAAIVTGLDAGEELVWTSDTDVENKDGSPTSPLTAGPGKYRILVEEELAANGQKDPARAVGNNAQSAKNMNGLLNHGTFSSADAT
jgi:hypothetical protein